MSLFSSIFGKSQQTKSKSEIWKALETDKDLENALKKSYKKKVVIFKHSTRCFISKTVLRNFESQLHNTTTNASYYLLDLIAHRNLSNKISEDLNIEHQSPQVIVIEKGKAVNNASHHHIDIDIL